MVSVNTQDHFTGTPEAYVGELAVAAHAVRMGGGAPAGGGGRGVGAWPGGASPDLGDGGG
ncbi:hypothetical protein [Nonomuraea salmonea]|uniref:hypothetical protein n=1 Tax=Nonomuraea salmonea TaxID=46181 RepID=UPI0031EA1273